MGYELETFHFFSDNNKLKAKTSIWGLLSSLRKKFGYYTLFTNLTFITWLHNHVSGENCQI